LRVALQVDALAPHPGGIGRYTWELCKGLVARDHVDVSFIDHGRLVDDPAALLQSTQQARRSRIRQWIDRGRYRSVLRHSLVHGPNYFLPDEVERGVITAHDLSVFRFPETHPVERVREFEKRFQHSLDRASHIITDTETVRREMIEAFGLRPERLSAVLLGVDPGFRPMDVETVDGGIAGWGLQSGSYGLCVSTLEPRKKIAELLRAWEGLPVAIRDRVPLVLAGGAGWRNEALLEAVERGVAAGWLKHLGFVDEAVMPALYAGARLFIYPSIYEGFGLPLVEAMASGVPVLTSNRSCMPEVCAGAARYINPDDISGFQLSIEEALTDDAAHQRYRMLGLQRAADFPWSRCIEGTVAAYRKALTEG
jgi:glycosyltransferase involved in cell wall biosynthesis